MLFARFFVFVCFSVFFVFSAIFQSRYEMREKNYSRVGAIGMQNRCVNCCNRTEVRIVVSICANEGYTLDNVAPLSAS